ncbi:peptidase inhibitor family I36 protein [Streptomyces nigra]|uniref:peptidase inhibitor family I36 protein n=1 Tax=Streptomyces nigra TaxID=1827580 RepID=UPI0036917A90
MKRRLATIGLATLSVFGFGLATASEAQAVEYCTPGRLCLYYNSFENDLNAVFIQTQNIADYNNINGQRATFVASSEGSYGAGQSVKNNAAAVINKTDQYVGIYYNSGYNCEIACQQFRPFSEGNLNATMKNNNASGSL